MSMYQSNAGKPPQRYRPALLALAVLLAAAMLVRGGEEQARPVPSQLPAVVPTGGELSERVLDRFDLRFRPQRGAIVHEVVEFEGPMLRRLQPAAATAPLQLERWYDYGPPARLRIEIRQQRRLIFAAAVDGRGRLQLQLGAGTSPVTGIRSRGTLRMTARARLEEAQRFVPILRQPYANGSLFAAFPTLPPPVQEILYAAQANPAYADETLLAAFFSLPAPLLEAMQIMHSDPAALQLLGEQTRQGRAAWLAAVHSRHASYLLTIDRQTYAVLDLRRVRSGGQQDAESSWRTTLLEVLQTVPEGRFALGPASWGYGHSGPPPPPWFWTRDRGGVPRRVGALPPFELLLPDQSLLPGSLRTVVWEAPERASIHWYAVTTLWSEYGLAMIVQLPRRGGAVPQHWSQEEQGRRFVLLPGPAEREQSPSLLAVVDTRGLLSDEPLTRLYVGLYLPLASAEERELLMRRVIATLAPATSVDQQSYWLFPQQ